jgi:hypothetical protein
MQEDKFVFEFVVEDWHEKDEYTEECYFVIR